MVISKVATSWAKKSSWCYMVYDYRLFYLPIFDYAFANIVFSRNRYAFSPRYLCVVKLDWCVRIRFTQLCFSLLFNAFTYNFLKHFIQFHERNSNSCHPKRSQKNLIFWVISS